MISDKDNMIKKLKALIKKIEKDDYVLDTANINAEVRKVNGIGLKKILYISYSLNFFDYSELNKCQE